MGEFIPLLTTRDWGAEWVELQKLRRRADSAAYWDERAHTFGDKDAPSPYVERFLELAAIRPGETVLDMGCGTGALAVPLGLAGHRVIAADFSAGMLARTRENLAARGVRGVETCLLSWGDGREAWEARGLGPCSVDVALASRSIATDDMRESLLRLTDVARRRACVTLAAGSSPRADERVLAAAGVASVSGRDFLYAFNILANEGLKPQVDYIESSRVQTFASREEAFSTLAAMVDGATRGLLPEPERAATHARLREWLEADLVENEHAGEPDRKGLPQGAYRLSQPRKTTWAFIAWDKE